MVVQKRRFGRTELYVSTISLGGFQLSLINEEEAENVVTTALDSGINYIDTAPAYGDSENKIGRVFKERKDSCYIATKTESLTSRETWKLLQQSLKKLKVDRVDVYQLHAIDTFEALEKAMASGGALEAVKEARLKGLIDYTGITGHNVDVLVEALKTGEFDVVLANVGPLNLEANKRIIPMAKELDVGLAAMKPFSMGAFIKVTEATQPFLEGVNLEAVREKLLRYLLSEEVATVVTGMRSIREVESNLKAVARFKPLEESERHFLEELGKKISRVFCRPGCGKCLPCPQGIEIDKVILAYQHSVYMEAEELGYKLYERLKVKPEKCDKCGVCEKKCPNGLPIPYLLEVAQRHFNIIGKRNS